jgi:hypothetical protein
MSVILLNCFQSFAADGTGKERPSAVQPTRCFTVHALLRQGMRQATCMTRSAHLSFTVLLALVHDGIPGTALRGAQDASSCITLSTYDADVGATGFSWNAQEEGFIMCNESNRVTFAKGQSGGCHTAMVYRTADNLPARDVKPDVYVESSAAVHIILLIMGSIVLAETMFFAAVFIARRKGKLAKASQPEMVYIIFAGFAISAGRTLVAGFHLEDDVCTTKFVLGHLSFWTIFSALLLKMWRYRNIYYFNYFYYYLIIFVII